jgi:hypothetical protein
MAADDADYADVDTRGYEHKIVSIRVIRVIRGGKNAPAFRQVGAF